MGSKQIDIGVLTSDVIYSVSPAYHTFKINGIDSDYLRYCLEWRNADMFVRYVKRGSRQGKNIDIKRWIDYKIPVYPSTYQYVVVENLNKVKKILGQLNQQIEQLNLLGKARFVEIFGDPVRNPMKWNTYQLSDCLDRIDNGKSLVCLNNPRKARQPAILKLSAVSYGNYRPSENKALLDENSFVEKAEVKNGDLLFTRKNTPELVGMATYVKETPKKLMMPDLIFRLVPNEKMNPVFLWQLINCKEFRPVIKRISGGSAKSMSNISKERLGKIKVICPPKQLQEKLVPFINQIDKFKWLPISYSMSTL